MVGNRIHWIDFYKTFSIFLIVLGHTSLRHIPIVPFLFLFHVPLFFFISGYLEKTERGNIPACVKKALRTLIVPYFIWNFICVIFHPLPSSLGDIWKVLIGMSLWNGASWFLPVLFIIKMVALLLKNQKYWWSTLLILFLVALFCMDKRCSFYANLAFCLCLFSSLECTGRGI